MATKISNKDARAIKKRNFIKIANSTQMSKLSVFEYYNFKKSIKPGIDRLYVNFWRIDIRAGNGLEGEYKKFLAKKVERLLSDEFCMMCERNSFEIGQGVCVSWVNTNHGTFLFRQPHAKYLEMISLRDAISSNGNYHELLQSEEFKNTLAELSEKTNLAFVCEKDEYNWNNILKY